MNRKRVMFFLPLMTSGGAERVSINILNQLDRNIYEIHLVLGTLSGDAIHILPKDVEVYDLKTPRTMFTAFKLRKLINQIKPYVIFSSLNRAHIALYFAMIGMKEKPKRVYRIPSSPKLTFQYNEMGSIFVLLLKHTLKNADQIIAQTPEMKDEIEKYYSVKRNKIKVYINPIDTVLIDESIHEPMDIFEKYHINVVASGRLRKEKGFDTLIRAFKIVYENNKNFRLFIIGADYDGEQKEYETLRRELGLENIVYFLGFQKNPYKFYWNSDLFVLSSRREGLPNTVLENLYLNKPVIGTRCIPFMSTLIKEGINGFLVDVDEYKKLAQAILKFKDIENNVPFLDQSFLKKKDIFEQLESSISKE